MPEWAKPSKNGAQVVHFGCFACQAHGRNRLNHPYS